MLSSCKYHITFLCFDSLLETSHHNFAVESSPLNSRKSHLFSVFSFVLETFNTNSSGLKNGYQLIIDKSFLKREDFVTFLQKDVILLTQMLEGKDVVGLIMFRPRYDLEKLSEAGQVFPFPLTMLLVVEVVLLLKVYLYTDLDISLLQSEP